MYLPELTGIEFLGQLFNALFNKELPFFRYDQSVFIFGLEVVRLLHGYEPDTVSLLSHDILRSSYLYQSCFLNSLVTKKPIRR